MTLTDLDKELLDGLQVLTDEEVSRVQAHLAAGLPMQIFWGYDSEDEPACFGCLVGTAMSQQEAGRRGFYGSPSFHELANGTFPNWARAQEPDRPVTSRMRDFEDMVAGHPRPLPQITLDRLAALLDMDWQRRHPLPAEYRSELIEPALENKPALMEVHS